MATSADPGQPGTCSTCGSYRYTRTDTIKSGSRIAEITVWDDATITPRDESYDWEVDDSTEGEWTCHKGHPVTDEDLLEKLETAWDLNDQVDLA